MTDLRSLLKRMANELDYLRQLLSDDRREIHALAAEARAALAQPPADEEPSDEELLKLAAKVIEPYKSWGIAVGEYEAETECAVEAYGSELVQFARAVLARWDSAQPQPVPVSERPWERKGWCDENGECWMGVGGDGFISSWRKCRPEDATRMRVSLSAHALPLPFPSEEEAP